MGVEQAGLHTLPFLNCTYRYNVIIIDYVGNLFLPKVICFNKEWMFKTDCLFETGRIMVCYYLLYNNWLVKSLFWFILLFK